MNKLNVKANEEITLINNKNLKGVIALSSLLTKKILDDIIDLIMYSQPETIKIINTEFKQQKKKKLIDGDKLRQT
ncbi:MAG: hypothetical protein V1770_06270 [bacterium]